MTQNNPSTSPAASQRFFERGRVCLEQENGSIEVSRGMAILTQDGWEAGKVAAVVVEDPSQQVTHLLLVRPHLVSDYRLVPVSLIEEVGEEMVSLGISSEAVESLPARRTS